MKICSKPLGEKKKKKKKCCSFWKQSLTKDVWKYANAQQVRSFPLWRWCKNTPHYQLPWFCFSCVGVVCLYRCTERSMALEKALYKWTFVSIINETADAIDVSPIWMTSLELRADRTPSHHIIHTQRVSVHPTVLLSMRTNPSGFCIGHSGVSACTLIRVVDFFII